MNHKQLYVDLELIEEDERPTAYIEALNFVSSFQPINNSFRRFWSGSVVKTQDLIRHQVTIKNSDYSKVKVKVVKVFEQNIILT